MASVFQLGYVGVGTGDLPAWEQFATQILGLAVGDRGHDGTLLLRMDEHAYRIAVHPDPSENVLYMGWQVGDEEALEAMEQQLREYGVPVTAGTPDEAAARKVRRLIKFSDPDGFKHEVYCGPEVEPERRFASPRPIAGFVTGDQGLGHMVIGVSDHDESLRWYRGAMGFRISDYVQVQRDWGMQTFVFLHCNARHHSIAFGMRGTPPGRLNHIMLQLNSLDDVGVTLDLCIKAGIEGLSRLGRHPNDEMVSFYIPSPSGWGFEYGWGARTVHDDNWQITKYTRMSNWGHERPPVKYTGQPVAARA